MAKVSHAALVSVTPTPGVKPLLTIPYFPLVDGTFSKDNSLDASMHVINDFRADTSSGDLSVDLPPESEDPSDPLSPRNSIGSDLELVFQNPSANLVQLKIDMGCPASPLIHINPSSLSNIIIRKGKGRPRIKKKSIMV